MATRVKLETKGFADYLERVAAAGNDVGDVAERALEAGGSILLAGMSRRVPVLTGNLKKNLDIAGPFRDGNFHYILVGISQRADPVTVRYGNAQEYGTSSNAPQSYIRSTLDEDMSKARKLMRQVFEEWGL